MIEDNAREELRRLVDNSLGFQRKWQRLSMLAYVGSTTGILFCTTAGTYAAASSNTHAAAILAAISTILIGLEKSLLFREKWKFHLAIATRLQILASKLQLQGPDVPALSRDYESILDNYAVSIPIASRDSQ